MSETEISRLLAADAPSARDPAFELAVVARIEQRRFRRAMLSNIILGLAAALLLALAAPSLDLVWQGLAAPLSNNLMIAALLLAGGVLAMPWLAQRD